MESKDKNLIISAICDMIDNHQGKRIDRNFGMFLDIEFILNKYLISRTRAIEELEELKKDAGPLRKSHLNEAIEKLKNLK